LILCSLLESWNGLVMVVSNSISSSSTLNFDDIVGVILSEEMRQKNISEASGNALTVQKRGRQRERGKISGNHGKSKKGRSKSIRKLECWHCEKKGHLKRDHWSRKGKQGDGQQ
jgi:hypothetical protein